MDWNDEDIGYKIANRVWGCGFTIIIVIILCLACSVCCSCTTKRTVTEYVEVHDTLITHNTDTVREVKVRVVYDTIRQVESHTYTLNNVGDTVREIHHYNDIMRTIVVDSTDRYKSKVDSLQAIIDKQRDKETVKVVRKPNWWAHAFVAAFAFVIAVWFLRWAKK